MRCRSRFLSAVTVVTALSLRLVVQAEEAPSFSKEIQPLLGKHCVLCHGPDDQQGGLRLDVAEQAVAELDSGDHAIVPGQPEQSVLLQRVTTKDEDLQMPPEGERLTAEEVDLLKRWIAGGAKFEEHWAYRPVQEPELPQVQLTDWVRNPIDQYVLARLEQEGLVPSPPADPAVLMKRLYYDLTGLPPTAAEVDAFLQDPSESAWEQMVDRLLGSEHFGERWGRHWLDKARYADSDGYEKDRPRPNAWRYRDWVIDAINQDLPFDQFTIEQLAGDLLPDATAMQKLATAFHRQTLTNTEGGTDQEEFRVEATFDRTETTGAVWMALTLTCARCHSHKYDQIPQQEYYQLFAFFNNANEANADVPRNSAEMAAYLKEKAEFDRESAAEIQRYQQARDQLTSETQVWLERAKAQLADQSASEDVSLKLVSAVTDDETVLTAQDDGSLLASGPVPDKDRYTLTFEMPQQSVGAVNIEVLPHESLPSQGPGRAGSGNLVISYVTLQLSDTPEFQQVLTVPITTAEADFSQSRYPAKDALSQKKRSGWAISPEMGKPHRLTLFPQYELQAGHWKYVRVIIDQHYGKKHLIGRLRVTGAGRFQPRKSFPRDLLLAVEADDAERRESQKLLIADQVAAVTPSTTALVAARQVREQAAPQAPLMPVRVIVPAERTTQRLHRGDFLQPSEEVAAGELSVVRHHHPLQSRHADQPADRLDLAQWLVHENHPLTPRVTVNHVWAHLFGTGIVPSLNDFGVRGELPTHPGLLDWLAWQFPREMKWSRKQLIRTIVMSSTWRQSSHHRPELAERDPANRLLARQNRLRVEAELVRDLCLSVSGLLTDTVGGPSVFPPLPPGVAELSYANNFKWKTSEGGDAYRRGMYTFFKRTSPHPTLISFDCPDSNTTRLQRAISNTPLQALVTLNNTVFSEAAQAFARRTFAEGGTTDTSRVRWALRTALVRAPTSEEVDEFVELLEQSREWYQQHADAAEQATSQHKADDVVVADNAAMVATVRMILNLDEFLVRD